MHANEHELRRAILGLRYRNAVRIGKMADELSKLVADDHKREFLREMAEGTKRLKWMLHRLRLIELRKYSSTEEELAAWRRIGDADEKDLAEEVNGDTR